MIILKGRVIDGNGDAPIEQGIVAIESNKLHMLVQIITVGDPRRCRCFYRRGHKFYRDSLICVHIGVLADRLFMTSHG